ncbi:PA2169 family four-helix-bundle protein [Pontibacter beigongshangensis]|uniref:PA2169 family four-helix-bundle protein n=1 Tax=Pontibacter beigongshangensis TaxID=2574733 RepID=UPI00164FCF28|nr:PA2169 family four-helix-bundle protein [Pontibacter beigongshangensis]
MKKTDEDVVHKLQELTEFVNDRVEGYEHAAKETENPAHTSYYRELSSQSRKFASELNSQISKYGGSKETDTTIKGKIYRQWMDLKETLTGHNEEAVINSNLYGEEWAQKAYNDALASGELPNDLQQLIEQQKQASLKACEQLKKMKSAGS